MRACQPGEAQSIILGVEKLEERLANVTKCVEDHFYPPKAVRERAEAVRVARVEAALCRARGMPDDAPTKSCQRKQLARDLT